LDKAFWRKEYFLSSKFGKARKIFAFLSRDRRVIAKTESWLKVCDWLIRAKRTATALKGEKL